MRVAGCDRSYIFVYVPPAAGVAPVRCWHRARDPEGANGHGGLWGAALHAMQLLTLYAVHAFCSCSFTIARAGGKLSDDCCQSTVESDVRYAAS